jgi:hypothetical protein
MLDVDDADQLVSAIAADSADLLFDVSGDTVVDDGDLTRWRAIAARENGFSTPFLLGDANLDGTVNASDLNALAQNWLSAANTWQSGDFNADGVINVGDLNKIGKNWLASIPTAASTPAVPEPNAWRLLVMGFLCMAYRRW